MEKQPPQCLAALAAADWEKTPESVRRLVGQLLERLVALAERQQSLEEPLPRNSKHSSQPASQAEPEGLQPQPQAPSKKRRGAQAGHQGHQQQLQPLANGADLTEPYPSHGCGCGASLSGFAREPQRQQIMELPPLCPIVVEPRFHAWACPLCGVRTRASDAVVVDGSRQGDRLCALVGLLSGEYRQRQRLVVRLLAESLAVERSVGRVGRWRQTSSEAVAVPVAAAHASVPPQGQVSVEATSFQQGNADGAPPKGTTGWLWVVVTPLVCYFQVRLSRSGAAAQTLLGRTFAGQVNSDRDSAYTWLALQQRQVCGAPLQRDCTNMSERRGVSREVGEARLKQQEPWFELWQRVRDGT